MEKGKPSSPSLLPLLVCDIHVHVAQRWLDGGFQSTMTPWEAQQILGLTYAPIHSFVHIIACTIIHFHY
jgi:hypothetical protein